MAGDWIPYEVALPTKGEVRRIAKAVGTSRFDVSGRLMAFWGWASTETADGLLRGFAIEDLVDVVGFDEAFWRAVVDVGWLRVRKDGLFIPNAERWITRAAKARLQKNRRQATWRDGHVGGDVDAAASTDVDADAPRKASTTEQQQQQNRREEPLEEPDVLQQPPQLGGSGAGGDGPLLELLRGHPFTAQILHPEQALAACRAGSPTVDLAAQVALFVAQLDEHTVAAHRRAGRGPAKALMNWVSKAAQIAAQEPNHGRSHRPEGRSGPPRRQAPGAGHHDGDPYAEDRERMERQRREFEARRAAGGGDAGG